MSKYLSSSRCLWLLALVAASCTDSAAERIQKKHGPDTIIPRAIVNANPSYTTLRLSPDGTQLAYRARDERGVVNIYVQKIDDRGELVEPALNLSRSAERDIPFTYAWLKSGTHIAYHEDPTGEENTVVTLVDVRDPSKKRALTPERGVLGEIQALYFEMPQSLAVTTNERDSEVFDVYRVDATTGERQRVFENTDAYEDFVIGRDLNVAYAKKTNDDATETVVATTQPSAGAVLQWSLEDAAASDLVGVDAQGNLLVRDSWGRNTAALVRYDKASKASSTIISDPNSDVGRILRAGDDTPVGAIFSTERPESRLFPNLPAPYDKIQEDQDNIRRALKSDDFEVVSRAKDDSRAIVTFTPSNAPHSYFVYDRSRSSLKPVRFPARPGAPEDVNRASSNPELDQYRGALTPMHVTTVGARDGERLVTYYSLPLFAADTQQDQPRPAAPLPTVLFVHGGPWERDDYEFVAFHQFLANRGYAVISTNFRGSTGFGPRFVNLGNGEWGGKMQDDLDDVVDWAVREKIANSQRVAIVGWSYGGYATLTALTRPESAPRYRCGISGNGVADLMTLVRSLPPYWKPGLARFKRRLWDWDTAEGQRMLNERSPLQHVANLRRPLLILQGATDVRVTVDQARTIAEAAEANGAAPVLGIFSKEGHFLGRPENIIAEAAMIEHFLAQSSCLGGSRLEPVSQETFAGSTLRVEKGLCTLPDIAAALGQQCSPQPTTNEAM